VTTPAIRLRRVDAPGLGPGVLLRVRHTLLPLYWLRGVPVLRKISHDLTVFERFVLEMALELGAVSGRDITEVLDLQPEFLVRGAWRLAVAGALRKEGELYQVVPEVATTLLTTKTLPQRVQSTADFVLLPRTGDLLGVASGRGGWLAEADRQRRKLRPHGAAPAPASLWSRGRAEYLAERVQAGDIAGSDQEIAEVVVPLEDDPPLLPSLHQPRSANKQGAPEDDDDSRPRGCPAYHCSAQVTQGPNGLLVEAELTAAPAPGRLARHDMGEDADHDGESRDSESRAGEGDSDRKRQRAAAEDKFTLRADLTGAAGLVASWQRLLDALDSEPHLRAAWRQVTDTPCDYARAERTGVSTWVFHIDGEAAEAIAASAQSLIEPAGLEIEFEETTMEAHIELHAADDAAQGLFERDLLVASLLAAPDPGATLAAAGSDEKALRERIWQLGHYRLAYALREAEDFKYE
jgi:hypothetical protein